MKIILDELVPRPVLEPLRNVLPSHQIDHVHLLSWSGKKDPKLFRDVVRRGYELFVTADSGQLEDDTECKLIAKAGFHHVRYRQHGSRAAHLASSLATILSGLPAAVEALQGATGQRLVLLKLVKCDTGQFQIQDPEVDPPPYWPRRRVRRSSP